MTFLRTALLLGVAAFGLGLIGACGSSDAGSTANKPATAADLDRRSFLSQQLTQAGADRPLAGSRPLSLTFSDGTLTASAGCNTMSGPYSIDNGALVVDALASTQMACEPAVMAQEQWLAEVLAGRPMLTLVGVSLTMRGSDSELLLVDAAVARPTPALQGTTWLLTTLVQGDLASSVPAGVESTLVIDGGRLSLQGACNRGTATVSIEGDVLRAAPIGMTRMACEKELMQLDEAIVKVLNASPTTRIEGQNLHLDADGAGLVYVAKS